VFHGHLEVKLGLVHNEEQAASDGKLFVLSTFSHHGVVAVQSLIMRPHTMALTTKVVQAANRWL
jgi:hypothetical protein